MADKQKPELPWIGKDVRSKLEPQILSGDPEKSYHAKHRVTENPYITHTIFSGLVPFAGSSGTAVLTPL